jgi:heme/copper-type cytochrome/quinol oxidase subunit 2
MELFCETEESGKVLADPMTSLKLRKKTVSNSEEEDFLLVATAVSIVVVVLTAVAVAIFVVIKSRRGNWPGASNGEAVSDNNSGGLSDSAPADATP